MNWKALEKQFEEMHQAGDWDAEWCFDPASQSRQQWQLTGEGGLAEMAAFNGELSSAGRILRREIEKKTLVPKKLVAGEVLMAEAWLNALRHLRINILRSAPEANWRRDEGRICDVAHASAQFCVRMRIMASRPSRSTVRRARSLSEMKTPNDSPAGGAA